MTTPRHTTAVAALAALAMLLTACAESTDGTPETPNDNSEQDEQHSSPELPHSGAPPVDDPIDTTRFEEDPCLALSDQQLTEYGYEYEDVEARVTMHADHVCEWNMGRGEGTFVIGFTVENQHGLSGVYQAHGLETWEVFDQADPVHGHPALFADPIDARERGACNVIFGANDELAVWVTMDAGRHSPHRDAPCRAAYELAELAVETMKGDS
ncbi:DUF3558 domain-containing protein [Haloechinothrix sp. LS1_15]|uniref:DUF3558 domain-containing protein n=1 Tax=Haloechinothrix sp. LS1_15 TaxID=2652248 RepID=UPI0029481051|nr:DUF3558 domain-containing protein [Haloechinothrix sp. LS1_15]MDV6012567.1 DUF3558 domain-containing protein [Haloechinothrix sp. LS1_15]